MGFFGWLGGLLDQLVEWLGRAFMKFIEALIYTIQAVWYTVIASVLIAAFGYAMTLYAIFYAGATMYETIMEVWDPRYQNKPSEPFSIEAAPPNTPLARSRGEVKEVMKLTNVQYSN